MDKSLQILSEKHLTRAEQTANSPVFISALRVAYDYTYNREILFLEGVNQSGKTLRSLYFDLACDDDAGDRLGIAEGACLRNLELAPEAALPGDAPVVIPFSGTCKVTLTLQKAVFADGSVWRVGDEPVGAAATEVLPRPTTESAPEAEVAAVTDASPVDDSATETVPEPVQIPAEWLNPPATVEGYRAAAEGLSSLGEAGKPYLIKKFTALADKLEKELAEAAEKAAEAERLARLDADYRQLLSRKVESADEYDQLAAAWTQLGAYKDSPRRAEEAKKKARSIRTAEKRIAAKQAEEARQAAAIAAAKRKRIAKWIGIGAGTLLSIAAIFTLIFAVILPAGRQNDYEAAEAYLENGEYTAALQAFDALGDYNGSAERAKQIRLELTGREDGLFYTSDSYPCYSIENGVLSYNGTKVYISDTTLRVPDYLDDQKVTTLADNCFTALKSVETVLLPPSVTSIGAGAFAECPNLRSFKSDRLIEIGAEAFRGCTALTEFTVPATVKTIGNNAFQGCTALKKVVLPQSVQSLADGLFLQCPVLKDLQFGSEITSIGAETFGYCISLTEIKIPATVTAIGNNAFLGCTGLAKLEIPDSVTAMGDKIMAGCTALTEVRMGNGITKLPARTFEGCSALKTVTLPALTQIGYAAFNRCTALTDLYIPDGANGFAKIEVLADNQPLETVTVHAAN